MGEKKRKDDQLQAALDGTWSLEDCPFDGVHRIIGSNGVAVGLLESFSDKLPQRVVEDHNRAIADGRRVGGEQ